MGDTIVLLVGHDNFNYLNIDSQFSVDVHFQYEDSLQPSVQSCLIAEGGFDTFLLIGGLNTPRRVLRYSIIDGNEPSNLDELNFGRRNHACGFYFDSRGRKVNMVAGGRNDHNETLDSCEVN